MTTQVQQALGIEAHHDGEANAMGRKTRVKTLVNAAESTEKDGTRPRRVKPSPAGTKE